jgi:hypothetical protein
MIFVDDYRGAQYITILHITKYTFRALLHYFIVRELMIFVVDPQGAYNSAKFQYYYIPHYSFTDYLE